MRYLKTLKPNKLHEDYFTSFDDDSSIESQDDELTDEFNDLLKKANAIPNAIRQVIKFFDECLDALSDVDPMYPDIPYQFGSKAYTEITAEEAKAYLDEIEEALHGQNTKSYGSSSIPKNGNEGTFKPNSNVKYIDMLKNLALSKDFSATSYRFFDSNNFTKFIEIDLFYLLVARIIILKDLGEKTIDFVQSNEYKDDLKSKKECLFLYINTCYSVLDTLSMHILPKNYYSRYYEHNKTTFLSDKENKSLITLAMMVMNYVYNNYSTLDYSSYPFKLTVTNLPDVIPVFINSSYTNARQDIEPLTKFIIDSYDIVGCGAKQFTEEEFKKQYDLASVIMNKKFHSYPLDQSNYFVNMTRSHFLSSSNISNSQLLKKLNVNYEDITFNLPEGKTIPDKVDAHYPPKGSSVDLYMKENKFDPDTFYSSAKIRDWSRYLSVITSASNSVTTSELFSTMRCLTYFFAQDDTFKFYSDPMVYGTQMIIHRSGKMKTKAQQALFNEHYLYYTYKGDDQSAFYRANNIVPPSSSTRVIPRVIFDSLKKSPSSKSSIFANIKDSLIKESKRGSIEDLVNRAMVTWKYKDTVAREIVDRVKGCKPFSAIAPNINDILAPIVKTKILGAIKSIQKKLTTFPPELDSSTSIEAVNERTKLVKERIESLPPLYKGIFKRANYSSYFYKDDDKDSSKISSNSTISYSNNYAASDVSDSLNEDFYLYIKAIRPDLILPFTYEVKASDIRPMNSTSVTFSYEDLMYGPQNILILFDAIKDYDMMNSKSGLTYSQMAKTISNISSASFNLLTRYKSFINTDQLIAEAVGEEIINSSALNNI